MLYVRFKTKPEVLLRFVRVTLCLSGIKYSVLKFELIFKFKVVFNYQFNYRLVELQIELSTSDIIEWD